MYKMEYTIAELMFTSPCVHFVNLTESFLLANILLILYHKKNNYKILDIVQTWGGVSGPAQLFFEKRYGHVLRG